MDFNFRLVLVTCVVCLAMASFLHGQESRATLEGRITDQQGALIPGASVEVTAELTGVKQQTISSEFGV